MEIELKVEGLGDFKVILKKGMYAEQRIALRLIDAEDFAPFATITVNVPNSNHLLQPGEFFVKTWAENEQVTNALREKTEIFVDTGRKVDVSHLATAEIWRLADGINVDDIQAL